MATIKKTITKRPPTKGDTIKLKQVNIKSTPLKAKSASLKTGGQVPARKIDSLKKANPALARVIGKPYKGSGGMDTYGDDASDAIKKGLKRR